MEALGTQGYVQQGENGDNETLRHRLRRLIVRCSLLSFGAVIVFASRGFSPQHISHPASSLRFANSASWLSACNHASRQPRVAYGGSTYFAPCPPAVLGTQNSHHELMYGDFEKARGQYGSRAVTMACCDQMSKQSGKPQSPDQAQVARHALQVTKAAQRAVMKGHPWVFAPSVTFKNPGRPVAAGDLGIIFRKDRSFVAVGLLDPGSHILLRVLAARKPVTIDAAFWREKVDVAIARRSHLFSDARTTGFRVLNGESDGLPGVVVDKYGQNLVVKLYSLAWLPHLAALLDALLCLEAERVVLRMSRNMQQGAEEFGLRDGMVVQGDSAQLEETAGIVVFLENGLRFEADVIHGQKTGFFLDQRENRARVQALCESTKARSVLNCFSFSGGFSLYASRGGASKVISLDLSAYALRSADRNFALNPDLLTAGKEHLTVQANCFDWLENAIKERQTYDVVITDPPSLAKKSDEVEGALKAYHSLASKSVQLVKDGGILVACSCSAKVEAGVFCDTVLSAARNSPARRNAEVLSETFEPADHPADIEEAHYLKCIYLRIG